MTSEQIKTIGQHLNMMQATDISTPSNNAIVADYDAMLAEISRSQADTKLADFKAEMLAGLKEAYGQGDWLNIHMMIQELRSRA